MKISEKILTQSSRGLMPGPDQNTSGRILRYFALETNIEGINNAGRSRSLVRAALWLGIFVIFLALTINDMTDLIRGIQLSSQTLLHFSTHPVTKVVTELVPAVKQGICVSILNRHVVKLISCQSTRP